MKSFALSFNFVFSFALLVDLTRQLENKYVRIGENVLFSCDYSKYENEKPVLLSWIREIDTIRTILTFTTHVLTPDRRIGVIYNQTNRDYTLQVARVIEEDSGIYFCAVNSTANAESDKFRLHVNRFDTTPVTLRVTKGDDVNLTCFEKTEPTPRITWSRSENRPLPNGDSTYVGPYLNFKVTKHDRGDFYCKTSTANGKVYTKEIVVDVGYAPEIYVKRNRQTASLGTAMELECIVDTFIEPSISWTFNGAAIDGQEAFKIQRYEFGLYSTSAVLRTASFQNDYYGEYGCSATNSLGTSSNTIQVQPPA